MNMQVDNTSTSSVTFGQLGPTSSLQLMFARLQLELAETAKSQAMDKMDAIAEAQDEQKLVSRLLNEARQAQADGKAGKGVGQTSISGTTVAGKDCWPMSQELVDYMDKNNLAYANADKDYILGEKEWNLVITSLEGRLEELGTNTQQEMVYIQDYMGQYNSYLQGANTQISNSNQTLTSLARGQ